MSSRRVGGRSAIVRSSVFAAASELVMAKGPLAVTMPEIAQRAGVAATSLYRRWGDVSSLLLDMAVDRLTRKWPLPDEGSIKADLTCWARRIVAGVNTADEPTFLRTLLAAWSVPPERQMEALAPRIEQIEAMLERSRVRGEKAPPLEDVIDHLLAPLYMRALLGLNVDDVLAERLTTRLLAIDGAGA